MTNPSTTSNSSSLYGEQIIGAKRFLTYKRSGKVDWPKFVALFAAALAAAIGCGFILYLLQDKFYYFVFVPLIVSIPALAMLFVAITFGRCRSSLVGAVAGLLIAGTFYFGFWSWSYYMNIVRHGPQSKLILELYAGRSDIVGYFIYYCKTHTVKSTTGGSDNRAHNATSMYGYYACEVWALFGIGIFFGFILPRRVFFEQIGEWASFRNYVLQPDSLQAAYDAVMNDDWQKLSQIPRTKGMPSKSKEKALMLRFEYLKSRAEAPMFLSLYAQNMERDETLKRLMSGRKYTRLAARLFWRVLIPSDQSTKLRELFPELAVETSVGQHLT